MCIYINWLGKGLGKKEDGIAAPIRANLKFDQSGIGYDTSNAESYGDKWWARTYNDAANSLDVKNKVMNLNQNFEFGSFGINLNT